MNLDSLKKRLDALASDPARDNWPDVRIVITQALDDFPEAKVHLARKLAEDRQDRSWPELRSVVLDNLQPFPSARESILAALKEAGA